MIETILLYLDYGKQRENGMSGFILHHLHSFIYESFEGKENEADGGGMTNQYR